MSTFRDRLATEKQELDEKLSDGEQLPAEGQREANTCAAGGKHLPGSERKIFGMRKCRKCGNLI